MLERKLEDQDNYCLLFYALSIQLGWAKEVYSPMFYEIERILNIRNKKCNIHLGIRSYVLAKNRRYDQGTKKNGFSYGAL